MNKVILTGRLTKEPEIRYVNKQDGQQMAVARFTLAVNRRVKSSQSNQSEADYIRCVAFGKLAEHAEKYYYKGIKISIIGRIMTGSYTNRDGAKVYTTDVIIEEQEFAESKKDNPREQASQSNLYQWQASSDGFMSIPDGLDGELPFI